jgi:anti-sigma B factor antagonist
LFRRQLIKKKTMVTSASLSVLIGKNCAAIKIIGRANFSSSPDFKALVEGLMQKGYARFLIELSQCVLMDSTFLGVLSGFGLRLNGNGTDERGLKLFNANERVRELLENLGTLHLFEMKAGELKMPEDAQPCTPEPLNPTHEQIARTSLEAHQTLMAVNPENVIRFKDVTLFLAEDLKSLEKCS